MRVTIRDTPQTEGDFVTDANEKSLIMNVRTIRASGQPIPPYNEVMTWLAQQNRTQMPQDLLLFDQETLDQMPEELRSEIKEM